MTIEKRLDISFISSLALREKQIQQNYRPIIAVHKWFARRPGTLFRGLILSEIADRPLKETFYTSNNLKGLTIVDPFMGGGTPLIEANRLGCDVIGYDINPMAYWTVRQEIEHLNLPTYRKAADELVQGLEKEIGSFYRTKCFECGSPNADVKYFLWVKQHACSFCGKENDLFPGYLLAEDRRHPKNVFVCANCGELKETKDCEKPGKCNSCGERIAVAGPARRSKYACKHCGKENIYPGKLPKPPAHRMYAMEYHCKKCRPAHQGRFFKKPSRTDLAKYAEAAARLEKLLDSRSPIKAFEDKLRGNDKQGGTAAYIPDDKIMEGDETARLHRWGYNYYREMFNARQLLGLELSCRAISQISVERVRNALATNLSDLLRYQNMLCRYDSMALKSLDIFSVHGFPVGLIQCESNFLGIRNGGGVNVGSGGWANIIEKYYKAKAYCDAPFEIRHENGRKIQVPILGEWIGDQRNRTVPLEKREVQLHCDSATEADIPPSSVDAVFTDPPYFGNVQYAELMDFCYVWLKKLIDDPAFKHHTTRDEQELTGNVTMERGLDHFTEGLSRVFQKMAQALKPGRPLAFTYHHNNLDAYYPVAVAMLDSGLVCSASLPCPAEMGASIHISGTGSSIVDTVFVCRSTGSIPARWLSRTPADLAVLVQEDIENLRAAGLKETRGDVRCIIYGHLIRLAIWRLRHAWDKTQQTKDKMASVAKEIAGFGGLASVETHLPSGKIQPAVVRTGAIRDQTTRYGANTDEIPF